MANVQGNTPEYEQDEPIHIEVEVPEADEVAEAEPPRSEEEPSVSSEQESAELDEEAMVEAAIQAGEEAAAADVAAEAVVLRAERDELAARVEGAEQQAQEASERFARLQADWENFRKRTAQERLAERERATEKLVSNLLPVIDDLERAIEHASQSSEGSDAAAQLVDGVDAVRQKFVDVLAKDGVEVIDPTGEAFNPLEHQAVGRVEDESVFEETVNEVYQRGYLMGGKVIRPAMVTVTFGGPKRPEAEPESDSEGSAEADDEASSAAEETGESA